MSCSVSSIPSNIPSKALTHRCLARMERSQMLQSLHHAVKQVGLSSILEPTPIQWLEEGRLAVKREDLRHVYLSGNKWHKLKYNLIAAKYFDSDAIVSFGGSYSNHIHALAAAGRFFSIPTLGMIRQTQAQSAMLKDAKAWGMTIAPMSRSDYRLRHTEEGRRLLYQQATAGASHKRAPWYVPEGGSNRLGVLGVADLAVEIIEQGHFSIWVVPCGTAATLAGLVAGLHWSGHVGSVKVIGVAVLKGKAFLERDVARYLHELGVPNRGYTLLHNYHHGGYAKVSPELTNFQSNLSYAHGYIDFDPVYTIKMAYAVDDLFLRGEISGHERVLMIHTGGLQGMRP